MRKTIKRIIAALMLIFMVSVITSPATVQAATKTTAAQQKKCAKKALKYFKKVYKNNQYYTYKVQCKKAGSRYTFTITATDRDWDIQTMKYVYSMRPDSYKELIRVSCLASKNHCKNAKKLGLKKPIVRYRVKSNDGFVFISTTNGEIDD